MKKQKLKKQEQKLDKNFYETAINSTLGDLAQEGFVDEDNFLRKILEEENKGNLTPEQAHKKILDEANKKFNK